MTALFHESFSFLLKPWELVTPRAGIGPISWHEKLKILHLMGANHQCCQASGNLDFNCPALAHTAQKACHSTSSACCPETHTTIWKNEALLPLEMRSATLLQQPGQRSLPSASPPTSTPTSLLLTLHTLQPQCC